METLKNDAYEYALLIKRELIALETLLENWGDVAGYSADDMSPDIDPDTHAEIVAAIGELEIGWPNGDTDLVSDYLNDTCLELTVLKATGDSDRARIEILRTCGGPRCDITRDTNDGDMVEISVHSGGDSSTIRVSVGTLAASLDELAGCY
jgi:hypothetical protein